MREVEQPVRESVGGRISYAELVARIAGDDDLGSPAHEGYLGKVGRLRAAQARAAELLDAARADCDAGCGW